MSAIQGSTARKGLPTQFNPERLSPRQKAYQKAARSEGAHDLAVIVAAVELAAELIEAFLSAHGEACPCDWCKYDWWAGDSEVRWDADHLLYGLVVGGSFLRSNVTKAPKIGPEAVAAFRDLIARTAFRGDDEPDEPTVVTQ